MMRQSLLRTLAFHAAWEHAPTLAEWNNTLDTAGAEVEQEDFLAAVQELLTEKIIVERLGRFVFSDQINLVEEFRQNELWFARKLRVARGVARWLARISSVRFVALCNTTALGHARDAGDLDFFVVCSAGSLMSTRALAVLPYKFLKRRPGDGGSRDAVCLSYFVTDDGLDLSSHQLRNSKFLPCRQAGEFRISCDDPYFRYWFLSLLPLYDDGISTDLWRANSGITKRHSLARRWELAPDLKIETPRFRIPASGGLESWAAKFQMNAFPPTIRERMNRDTRVMITDKVLKFHVDDRREYYRQRYEAECRKRGVYEVF
jgi:hypothetical protein